MGDSTSKVISMRDIMRDAMAEIETGVKKEYEPFLKFREIPQPLEKLIAIAKNPRIEDPQSPHLDTNCHGTSFFLFGILPYDMFIPTNDNNHELRVALARMIPSDHPLDYSIAVWFKDSSDLDTSEIFHSAFIERVNSLQGYHRMGTCGLFRSFTDFSAVESYVRCAYLTNKFIPKYYTLNPSDHLNDWAEKRVRNYCALG